MISSTIESSTTLSANRTVSMAVSLLESTKPTETMASDTIGDRTFETKVIYETTTAQEGASTDETTVTNEKTTAGKEPVYTQMDPPFLYFRFTLVAYALSCSVSRALAFALSTLVSCFLLLALSNLLPFSSASQEFFCIN